MKITSINNNYYQINNKKNSNLNFKGLTNGLIDFWKWVDDGGRGIQFTVEDMCSTNIERTGIGIFKDIKAYKKKKKEYNQALEKGTLKEGQKPPKMMFPSTLQEGVREFLTGPTMTFTPAAVLALCTLAMGKNANVHNENLINLTELMKQVPQQSFENCKANDEFIKLAVQDLLDTTLDVKNGDSKATSQQVEQLQSAITSYYSQLKERKPNKDKLAKGLESIQSTYVDILKTNKKSFKGNNFLNVKFSLPNSKVGCAKIKQYADYICSYLSDFSKRGSEVITKNSLNTFRNNWIIKRSFVNVAMWGLTAIAMSVIPKLYTSLSGNINPNAKDVYEEESELKAKNGGAK